MCGIIGILGRKEVADRLMQGLRRLEYRGYDSAGICTIVAMGMADLSLRDRVDFDRKVRALDLLPPWTGEKDKDD